MFDSLKAAGALTSLLKNKEAIKTAGERIKKRLAELHAEMEWVKTQEREKPQDVGLDQTVPCYFNTGCCCFSDGDITGIELADGNIRLVRWPDKDDKPRRTILESAKIMDVLAEAQAKRMRQEA